MVFNAGRRRNSRFGRVLICFAWMWMGSGSAFAQTVWKSASDGAWSDDSAWSAGVPNLNAAFITNAAASYTVSVGAGVVGAVTDLTLSNAVANTTAVAIAGGTLLGSNGVIRIGVGSRLVLKTGGAFFYDTDTARSSDFATVLGLLRIEDGLFRVGRTNFQNRLNTRFLTLPAGGAMEMTNGVANFYSGSAGGLYVNGGALRMSGGTMTLANTNDAADGSLASLKIDNAGYVRLEGTAALVTSNAIMLDSAANTTTRLEVASADARFVFASTTSGGRPSLNASGYTAIDVRGGRATFGVPNDWTENNFYPKGGTVAANVWDGGYLMFRQIVMGRGMNSGMAQINVYGGTLALPGAGTISVGRDSAKAGVIAQVNVTNGVLDMSDTSKTWTDGGAPALAVGWNYAGNGQSPWGQFNLSGGVVTNAGGCALGLNKFTRGDFIQSGGVFRQGFGNAGLATNSATGMFVAGFSGGRGNCAVSNGLFEAVRDVYIGGVNAQARWGMTKIYAQASYGNTNVAPGSVGTFVVAGGTVVISNTVAGKTAALHVGDYGTGTVTVVSGSLYAQAVELHASEDGSQASTLHFTVGAQGPGTLSCGALTIARGAKLEVDASAYSGGAAAFRLVSYTNHVGSFAASDVAIAGDPKWQVRMTGSAVVLRRDRGLMIRIN